jgi:branched-chain amino acid transport system permease protein
MNAALAWVRRLPISYGLVALAVIALAGLPSVATNYQSVEWTYVLIYAIGILGLNILVGYNGQISLGHGAFMALGAYTTGILVHKYHVNYLITIPLAGLLAGAVGFVLGIPALRLSSLYLALATFALAVIMPSLLKRPVALTQGTEGIILKPPQDPFGLVAANNNDPTQGITSDVWLYYITLAIAIVLFWLSWNLLRNRPGRALRAIRDAEVAAAASGVNIPGYKTLAFAISAGYAGIAGSLYGLANSFVHPDEFQLSLSILLLVGAVIGGLASIPGPLIGGIFAFFLPIAAQQWIPVPQAIQNSTPAIAYGVLLILIMLFAPNGVVGLLRTGYAQLRRRIRGSDDLGAGHQAAEGTTI